ncbi:hypothetical protein GIW81_08435 [Hyphomicrobium sp. xq]|uniref:Trypsin-like peptidase domain-containing protein n=1 Tax=Hyphomicrobium album TaxID=2665159 RepID=A0A6I3KK94_9HYPH|nr:hypothetical protein [Hyphomicrobium album]MTD94360.1 hypothetical protein [Hyphomicrobium album]
MKLAEAQSLKESILDGYYSKVIGTDSGVRTQSALPIERPERRIAVGLSRIKGGYRVEIRIHREGGAAESLTKALKAKHGSAINVAVIQRLEIAPINAIRRLLGQRQGRPPRAASGIRPIELGLSIGHPDGGPGTLGAIVEVKGKGDAILSNAHVFAPSSEAKSKDPIYQPGREGRPLALRTRVGALLDFTALSKTGANSVDAAVALIDEGIEHTRNVVPPYLSCDCAGKPIRGVVSALSLMEGTKLAKLGRTTGYTEGALTAQSVDDVTILYHGVGNLRFDNVLEVTWPSLKKPFSEPGDSGALVFDPGTMKAVGLHFAGGVLLRDNKEVGVSYACDIRQVLDSLECTLVK